MAREIIIKELEITIATLIDSGNNESNERCSRVFNTLRRNTSHNMERE
jgi:hypothetical protein